MWLKKSYTLRIVSLGMPSWCVCPRPTFPVTCRQLGACPDLALMDNMEPQFLALCPIYRFMYCVRVTGYTALVNLAHLTPADTVFLSRIHNWLIATWALSIATQLGATLLIGYRFWKSIQWNTLKGLRASRLSILWILVESGALSQRPRPPSCSDFVDEHRCDIRRVARPDQRSGSDAYNRARRAEELGVLFFFYPCKRFHQ
ncbi:hypothetical protein EDB84DRAFT_715464 [Lactarius hengduanensis]|nr:hypothetical protein EDB84DRAFT_715464 [Lactarius hengduanensis]